MISRGDFPGAADLGLVAGSISWLTAFKFALFVALLANITGMRSGRNARRGDSKLKRNEVYTRSGNSESFAIRVVTPLEALDG